jgi:hypothetical protein
MASRVLYRAGAIAPGLPVRDVCTAWRYDA